MLRLLQPGLFLIALVYPITIAVQQPTVIRAARMLDVVKGEMIAPAMVVVADGKIRSIGSRDVPAGATTFDLGDVTLLPGLIDAHTHLTFDISGDWVTRSVRELPADAALRGARNARVTLLAGFTTVRDVGAPGFADVSLMKAIDEGFVVGPRMVPSAHAIGITGGHCDDTGWAPGVNELGPEQGVADGVDQAVRAVRYQIKHGAKVIKVCATAGVLSFDATVGAQQLSDAELHAIVQEAGRHGIKVAAHAHGREGVKAAIRAGVASIEHGSMIDDEAAAMMKQKGTFLVPTAYLMGTFKFDSVPPSIATKARQVIPLAQESHRRAIRAGVKIAFGTDAAVSPHGEMHGSIQRTSPTACGRWRLFVPRRSTRRSYWE
jgi:imidazolonepropionase-like amidohydrolase